MVQPNSICIEPLLRAPKDQSRFQAIAYIALTSAWSFLLNCPSMKTE